MCISSPLKGTFCQCKNICASKIHFISIHRTREYFLFANIFLSNVYIPRLRTLKKTNRLSDRTRGLTKRTKYFPDRLQHTYPSFWRAQITAQMSHGTATRPVLDLIPSSVPPFPYNFLSTLTTSHDGRSTRCKSGRRTKRRGGGETTKRKRGLVRAEGFPRGERGFLLDGARRRRLPVN